MSTIEYWKQRALLAEKEIERGVGPTPELRFSIRGYIDILSAVINEWEKTRCAHEELVRGGTMWTICTLCDKKWSDDNGGFKPDIQPEAIKTGYAVIETLRQYGV